MTIIRPHDKPRLWWLFPWSYARTLHTAANALRALCDRQDALLKDKVKTRPRWEIERWEGDYGVRYYFRDTDPKLHWSNPTVVFHGNTYLYDGASKYFAFETDPAKAIERVTDLNR